MMPFPAGGRLVGTVDLKTTGDIVAARHAVSKRMDELRAKPIRKTRFVTAVSEIARNTVVHGGGGLMKIYVHERPKSISVICEDQGRGIADLDAALRDGFTTAGSMGHGLGGAKRLADGFEIVSEAGRGTTVRLLGTL